MATPYEELRPYLRRQEQLLWSGRPDPQVIFAPSDVFMVRFSLMGRAGSSISAARRSARPMR